MPGGDLGKVEDGIGCLLFFFAMASQVLVLKGLRSLVNWSIKGIRPVPITNYVIETIDFGVIQLGLELPMRITRSDQSSFPLADKDTAFSFAKWAQP